MNSFIKQFIILILIILVIAGIYLGAILPFMKSQSFIKSQNNLSSAQTTEDIKNLYDVPLNFTSPIGQEEVVKYSANTISGIVLSQDLSEDVARWLVSYIDPYLFRNDVRHLLMLGDMHQALWYKFGGNDEDFKKAEEYYLMAYEIGPKLPPVLYNLVQLYYRSGDVENMKKYGNLILEYWPQDQKIRDAIQSIK